MNSGGNTTDILDENNGCIPEENSGCILKEFLGGIPEEISAGTLQETPGAISGRILEELRTEFED